MDQESSASELPQGNSSMLSKSTPRKPLVRQLLLFLDDTGVIRFGKRVHNAPVSKSTKLLLFPPPKDSFTELDISDTITASLARQL